MWRRLSLLLALSAGVALSAGASLSVVISEEEGLACIRRVLRHITRPRVGASGHWVRFIPEGVVKCKHTKGPQRVLRRAIEREKATRRCTVRAENETWEMNSIRTEVIALRRLSGLSVTPRLVAFLDDPPRVSCMLVEHAGDRLTPHNVPDDAEQQASAIAHALRKRRVSHNDIKQTELLVDNNGRLRLIDFGYATPSWDAHVQRWAQSCALRGSAPTHFFDDETGLASALEDVRQDRAATISSNFSTWYCANADPMPTFGRRPAETHVVVVWNASNLERVVAAVRNWSSTRSSLSALQVQEAAVVNQTARTLHKMCIAMYLNTQAVAWHKSCSPFGLRIGLLLIRDRQPRYGWRSSISAHQNLNLAMHDLKSRLRNLLAVDGTAANGAQQCHTSVNREEVLLTLRPLGMAQQVLSHRPHYRSLNELFQSLDKFAPLRYVVMRSHLEVAEAAASGTLGASKLKRGKDVDVLVNDYYYFKAVTGALSTDPVNMREQNSGRHIQNTILVGGLEVRFDVRYVGDGYVDPKWASGVLMRRKRHTYAQTQSHPHVRYSFHIPSDEDQFFLLLYHCLVQKTLAEDRLLQKVSSYLDPLSDVLLGRYHRVNETDAVQESIFTKFMSTQETPSVKELVLKTPRMWAMLHAFMTLRTYRYTCPNDPSVGFTLPSNGTIPKLGCLCNPRARKNRLRACTVPAWGLSSFQDGGGGSCNATDEQ